MKVAIFNVKYSPNLGDGVIAECLEYAFRQRAGWRAWSIDLAGRTRWNTGGGGRDRALKLALLQRMPGWLRDATVGLVLEFKVRRGLMRQWRALLQDADVAVFGGGQLIQDGDLNFPIKLARAADACRQLDIATAVFAVGAAPCRSTVGRRLFDHLLRSDRLVHAAARDEVSCGVLREFGCEAQLCCDPGLLAGEVWPVPAHQMRERPRVGLGITHPAVLAHHRSFRGDGAGDALSLYVTMAERLQVAGYDVVCFTNGAAEDELFLAEIGQCLGEGARARNDLCRDGVQIAARCHTPEDLAQLVAGFDAVVAHRLHAAILAYAYRIPCVGLRWDDKLDRFYQSVDRSDFVVPFDGPNADAVTTTVGAALEHPIDRNAHARILAETMAGIDRLIAAITTKVTVAKAKHTTGISNEAAVDAGLETRGRGPAADHANFVREGSA